MNLAELEKGTIGTILKINAGKDLKQRLSSFGIYKGTKFELKAISLGGNTLELKVGNSLIALRKGEAQKIEVEYN